MIQYAVLILSKFKKKTILKLTDDRYDYCGEIMPVYAVLLI